MNKYRVDWLEKGLQHITLQVGDLPFCESPYFSTAFEPFYFQCPPEAIRFLGDLTPLLKEIAQCDDVYDLYFCLHEFGWAEEGSELAHVIERIEIQQEIVGQEFDKLNKLHMRKAELSRAGGQG